MRWPLWLCDDGIMIDAILMRNAMLCGKKMFVYDTTNAPLQTTLPKQASPIKQSILSVPGTYIVLASRLYRMDQACRV